MLVGLSNNVVALVLVQILQRRTVFEVSDMHLTTFLRVPATNDFEAHAAGSLLRGLQQGFPLNFFLL